jgi:N-acetylglucosamine kinase-like BadF-type ATPase
LRYIAGIDGGGTKTTLEIRNIDNGQSIRKTFGAFNINSTGEEQFKKLLRNVFEELVPIEDYKCICIGAAGISNPRVQEIMKETAKAYRYTGELILKGDHEIALRGALGADCGMILIAGTGSICYGINEEGRIVRAGGWGHLIDDGGSAYALARDGFAAVVQGSDGRREKTLLTSLYYEKLGIHTPEEIVPFLYHSKTDKGTIAAFSTLVEQAAGEGDRIALQIIQQNASLLMELIRAVYHQLAIPNVKLALLGGLMSHETTIKSKTIELIKQSGLSIEYIEAKADAVAGAISLAQEVIE